MIYKFSSKAAAELIMLAASGDQVLRIIGKEPAARGIIEAAALPAAMRALERAIADDEAAHHAAATEHAGAADAEGRSEGGRGHGVRLRQRAWPMLEMMKRASAEQADIVWGA